MKLSSVEFNLPNFFSFLRVILVPVFIYFLWLKTVEGWLGALVVFGVAAFTDFLDGWTARKLKQVSEFGEFIDPLADKLLVISSLVALIVLDPNLEVFDLWMIIVIVGRDVLITLMRMLALRRGKPLRTSRFGKFKTAFQMIGIILIILTYMAKRTQIYVSHESLTYWIMLAVTILTALSGLRYLFTNWQLFFPEKHVEKKLSEELKSEN